MKLEELDEDDIRRIFDYVLGQTSFLIYQQQKMIINCRRKIRVFELYKQSKVIDIDDGKGKLETCNREIANAKNQIDLRQNYIRYLNSGGNAWSKDVSAEEIFSDPLEYYIENLSYSKELIENPLIIMDTN